MKQKLDAKAVANSLAIVVAIFYILCIVLIQVNPGLALSIGNYFFHGIDITDLIVVRSIGYSLISLILGTISAWIFGYIFALIYNKFAR